MALDDLHRLLYTSITQRTLPQAEVHSILEVARRVNEELSITGILLYDGTRFLQLLEGPSASILWLYPRIASDPRHIRAETLLFEPISRRRAQSWRMAYHSLNDMDANERLAFQGIHKQKSSEDRAAVALRVFENFLRLAKPVAT